MVVLMGFNAFGTTLQSLWIMFFFARKDFPCGVRIRMQDKILFRQLGFSPFSSARYFDICLRRFLSEDFWHCSLGRGFENIYTIATPGRRQSKTLSTIDKRGSKIDKNSVFDCHLSPVWRQIAIENSVSNDFYLRSSIVLAFSIAAYPV